MKETDRRLRYLITQIPIDPAVWYIAVGLGHPGGAGAAKGWVVHPLKTYMSWVQNVARQFGSISWECYHLRGSTHEYERNLGPAPLVYRLCQASPGSHALFNKT